MTESPTSDVVYVLSSGEYSDYRVLCACPSKADAEALRRRFDTLGRRVGNDTLAVEELPMVTADARCLDVLHMATEILDDGIELNASTWHETAWPWEVSAGDQRSLEWSWYRPARRGGGRLTVWGTDHERVRKVYGDRRAALLTDPALRARQEMGSHVD
jgi:hypothetical protein